MKATPKPAKSRQAPLGELALIDFIRRHQALQNKSLTLRLGIGDDCAILVPPPGHELLVTTDFSLETRHFRRKTHPPEAIGHRCLARGLSDLAAMGAKPLAAFLSLALPASIAANPGWLDGFLSGFNALARLYNVPLAGGDTAESPSNLILADICLLGSAPRNKSLRRATAQAGDNIYVTGTLGGAAAELRELGTLTPNSRNARLTKNHPHLYPQPRLAIGQTLLRRNLATAAIDISDGLSTDLAHLCAASNLQAELTATAIPLHPLATRQLNLALHGGEDYELLFTASTATKIPGKIAGIPITRIGTMLRPRRNRSPLILIAPNGRRAALEPRGWQHFRSS